MDADAQGCDRAAEVAVSFVEHAGTADGPRAEHLRRCPACVAAVRELLSGDGADPELERRLLRVFRDWRDGA